MRPIAVSLRAFLLALMVGAHWNCVGACDMVRDSRPLPVTGDYRLDRFEGVLYDLRSDTPIKDKRVILDIRVERIGWNDAVIVAWGPVIERDRSGWVVIDANQRTLQGPLSDAVLEDLRRRDGRLRDLSILPVKEAWARLGWFGSWR